MYAGPTEIGRTVDTTIIILQVAFRCSYLLVILVNWNTCFTYKLPNVATNSILLLFLHVQKKVIKVLKSLKGHGSFEFLAFITWAWPANFIVPDYYPQKLMFSAKGFFSKCDQIRRILQIWSHLPKKSLLKNFHQRNPYWKINFFCSDVFSKLILNLRNYFLNMRKVLLHLVHLAFAVKRIKVDQPILGLKCIVSITCGLPRSFFS